MNQFKLPLLASALALTAATAALSGCGNKADTTATAPDSAMSGNSAMSGSMDNSAMTNSVAKGATLGTPTKAGPFEVTLSIDTPQPKVGDAGFKATVTRDGKPVTNASVKLETAMPQMKMAGPNATLAHTRNGVYAGKANLSMGGAYRAKINVSAEGASGVAVYDFRAVQ